MRWKHFNFIPVSVRTPACFALEWMIDWLLTIVVLSIMCFLWKSLPPYPILYVFFAYHCLLFPPVFFFILLLYLVYFLHHIRIVHLRLLEFPVSMGHLYIYIFCPFLFLRRYVWLGVFRRAVVDLCHEIDLLYSLQGQNALQMSPFHTCTPVVRVFSALSNDAYCSIWDKAASDSSNEHSQ